jgi:hypothetical protein
MRTARTRCANRPDRYGTPGFFRNAGELEALKDIINYLEEVQRDVQENLDHAVVTTPMEDSE